MRSRKGLKLTLDTIVANKMKERNQKQKESSKIKRKSKATKAKAKQKMHMMSTMPLYNLSYFFCY